MAAGSKMLRRGWIFVAAALAATGWAAWKYHQTGRWPFQPKGEFAISEKMFDRILVQLRARKSIPPRFAGPRPLATTNTATRMCGLERQPVTWSRSVLDKKASTRTTPTYSVETRNEALLTSQGAGGVVFATADTFAVNVDGSPRAYHPGDIYGTCDTAVTGHDQGKKVCAINFLCYAGVRIFNGTEEIRCGARDNYKRAWNEIWGEISAGRANPIPRGYWDRGGAEKFATYYGFFHASKPLAVMFRSNIIRQAASGKPCQRDVAGTKYEGYFVAATSLTGDEGPDEREGRDVSSIVTDNRCNPVPFIDAEKLPNIVIPVGGFAGARVGDLVTAYRKDAQGAERWVYAIVGDQGPNHKFGEGSVAFNAAINGVRPDWPNYTEIVRNLHISPADNAASPVAVLIFKNTRAGLNGLLSGANVQNKARAQFAAWGGGDIAKSKERFRACLAALTDAR